MIKGKLKSINPTKTVMPLHHSYLLERQTFTKGEIIMEDIIIIVKCHSCKEKTSQYILTDWDWNDSTKDVKICPTCYVKAYGVEIDQLQF